MSTGGRGWRPYSAGMRQYIGHGRWSEAFSLLFIAGITDSYMDLDKPVLVSIQTFGSKMLNMIEKSCKFIQGP